MSIEGVDFAINALPLAQAAALIEVRRFRLHVALSDVHRALEAGDAVQAEVLARAALEAELAASRPAADTGGDKT